MPVEHRHKNRHTHQNGIEDPLMNYSIEFAHFDDGHMDLRHEPIVTERYGHFDG